MEPANFSEAQLKNLSYNDVKVLLEARGLSTKGYKLKLIQRLLEFQKTGQGKKSRKISKPSSNISKRELPIEIKPPKEIIKGKYLEGKGKYQREYNDLRYLLNETGLDGSEEGNFFDAVIFIYQRFFNKGVPFDEAYSEIKIRDYPIAEEYDDILYEYRNIQLPEEYEEFMDRVVPLISNKTKDKDNTKGNMTAKLLSYEDPRYHDIPISSNLLDYLISEIASRINPRELHEFLLRNRMGWFDFRPGDVIGFRSENSLPNSLPDVLLYIDMNQENKRIYYESIINYKGDQDKFKKTGRFDLPGDLKYGSPELLENIYHFPFTKLI